MKIPINCPHCEKIYNITDPKVGDKWDCPYCHERAVIQKASKESQVTITIRTTNTKTDNAFSKLF